MSAGLDAVQAELVVGGMSCGSCAARIERRLNKLDGVSATVNYATGRAYFTSVGSTYTHVILHRKATAGGARAAYTTDTVTAADIPSTFAVQRRRADKLVPSRLSVTV